MNKRQLAQGALTEALRLRRDRGKKPWEPVSVLDLADALGVEVRFVDHMPSLEGVYYVKDGKAHILISTGRPAGRRNFTCAHELGHHVFGHGSRIDQYLEAPTLTTYQDQSEVLADLFAGFLLMPKTAVNRGLSDLGIEAIHCSPPDILKISGWLGVGYSSLITHMQYSLNLISAKKAQELVRISPKRVRAQILGCEVDTDVYVADSNWSGRPVDLQIGDFVVLPHDTVVACPQLADVSPEFSLAGECSVWQAHIPGLGRISSPNGQWTTFVRVSRRSYVGLAGYRHLEEVEDE